MSSGLLRAIVLTAALAVIGDARAKPGAGGETGSTSSGSGRGSGGGGPLGVGLILGDPTAVGVRYWMAPDLAVQGWLGGAAGWGGLRLSGDLVFAPRRDFYRGASNDVSFDFWLGGGVVLGVFGSHAGTHCHNDGWGRYCHTHDGGTAEGYVGARAPVGLSLWINRISLETFIEVAPTLVFIPFVGFDFDLGLGARYYF
jgi:hypothetical protein